MAKKNNKTKIQKPEAALQTDVAQITATGRVIAEHPSNFITPQKMRALFEDAESGDIRAQHELFADIEERDSDIAANMGTRKRALLTLNWRVAPPRNATPEEEKLSDQAYEMMDSLPTLEDLIMDLMDAVGHGFSALEVEWVFSDGLYLPRNFIHRPQSWFKWDKDNGAAAAYPRKSGRRSVVAAGLGRHTQKSRSVQQARKRAFPHAFLAVYVKHYAVHDFAEFLELYGMPIRIGKYGAGATKEEKNTLLRAVAEIGHNAAGIMPEGMEIELHNAASGTMATSNPFLQMADW
ncbi:phage portal protein family protein [Neisseria meningitidis]|uniref:phage portal protein family protein n=1 Tax=Neisseria meningitidis TaxID=487 RepID=UPI004026B311